MSSSENTVSPEEKWTRRPRCSNSRSETASSDEQTADARTAQSLQSCQFGSIVTTGFIDRPNSRVPIGPIPSRAAFYCTAPKPVDPDQFWGESPPYSSPRLKRGHFTCCKECCVTG